MVRPGGRVIVANATGRSGYIQRPLRTHGHSFIQRTYIHNGISRAHIYRPWSHGGRAYSVYVPSHYYRPRFYTWVHTPWSRPIRYRWVWHSRPWYGYYGRYFTPYPTYVSPSFWLADFLIATTLETAYLAQNASVSRPPVEYTSSTTLTPEVKEAIADEVSRQMQQAQGDQAAAQGMDQVLAPPPIFSERGPRVFIVSEGVIGYGGDQEYPLMEGDVLQLAETPAVGVEWAKVQVLSSRSRTPKGSFISVKTEDLQEMQNRMQVTIDQGMAKLQADQGKNGIPTLPAQALGTVNSPYASDVRPDSDAQSELALAAKEANQEEQAIIQEGAPEPAGSGATISLGMSIPEVEDALGRPTNTVDLGSKKIYVYKNLKVTFLKGRVSDVQ